MTVFFYDIFLWLYTIALRIASVWNPKAKKWLKGRRRIFDVMKSSLTDPASKIIWVHCSSLGEFEQGRPVFEKLKTTPNSKLLITFFSPSGYEIKKNYREADYIFYLPMDSKRNAQRFLQIVNPALAIFIKYDYWYHYLTEIKRRQINCLLISAVFRKNQPFFKWYGSLQRKMLSCFTRVFVQNEESKGLLTGIGIENATIAGDTRFDTVMDIADNFEPIGAIEKFIGDRKCIVAGSTWPEDEEILQKTFLNLGGKDCKLVIAPHEIDQMHLDKLKMLFPQSLKFSELANDGREPSDDVLIIDNIGMLSRLYRYAFIAYVGGGFTRDGVHNVLEAAVYGRPVVFGGNYKKYKEAIDLINSGGATAFSGTEELVQICTFLLTNEQGYIKKCEASKKYVQENVGATKKILAYIEEKRLLTS